MTEYKIVIEETAENDLVGILSYISDTLHEPTIAIKIYGSIKKEILTLNKLPFRFATLNEEPYRSMGVRRIPVENYTAFYAFFYRKDIFLAGKSRSKFFGRKNKNKKKCRCHFYNDFTSWWNRYFDLYSW